jgi:transcriptional regulator with XRE-family HTH domain
VPAYDERLSARLRQLGTRIRTERQRLGLSQEELADRAGLHRTYVGAVERAERNISLGTLWLLADTMGVRESSLIDD